MKSICRNIIIQMNNKKRKKYCLLLLVLSLCFLSACGNSSAETKKMDKLTEGREEETSGEKENLREKRNTEEDTSDGEETAKTEADKSGNEAENPEGGSVTMAQLMGNQGSGNAENQEQLSDTILWFNATYAPLTYSNGWNWRLISGLEMTQDNQNTQKYLLGSSWSIYNREQALETIDSIKERGHRESCRNCMEELEELGMLDLEEAEFAAEFETFLESHTDGNPLRYIVAYYMYQQGMDADSIAAWDLCRVNQLYADCYFCGYLTYEEAMDGSLENSLLMQQMYSSWEEMVASYMMGYQFWQGDLIISEDSPTMERYHYYEMLCERADGPYTLDWNMKLEKDW